MERAVDGDVHLRVRNVGGIDETSVELLPGVTALTGRNATNRTSLLQAIMAAVGSERVSLKGDADQGNVGLEVGGETYTRQLARSGDGVTFDGEPYLDDPTVADLFAFLLESNEARLAVARQDDLRDIIMRPVDTEELRAEIEEREREKRRIADQLEELTGLEDRLPDLEARRRELEEELERKRAALGAKEEELEAADASVRESREEKSRLEGAFERLRETRTDLESVRYDLETQRERLDSLREERAEAQSTLAELPAADGDDVGTIEEELGRLRERKQRLESDINELRSTIRFNEDMLSGADEEVLDSLRDGGAPGEEVTDRLLEDGTVTCWTCGSEVRHDQIETTVDRLRELSQRKLEEIKSIESEIEERGRRKHELERHRENREQIERTLSRTDEEIGATEDRIAGLEEREAELAEAVETIEAEVEQLESDEYSEVLELHREVNELEFGIDDLEADLAEVDREIAATEKRLAERDRLEARRGDIQGSLTDLRTRVETLEREAVSAFNDHMEAVLDALGYANLERIWIERTGTDVTEGRERVVRSRFDLHVVRSTDSGSVYEDSIDHLSESEREVTGLIFALAGYLAHEVYETVPFMLLDSLEAIDSERIATLIEYFHGYADYLVVALLPEDAAGLELDHHRVTDI